MKSSARSSRAWRIRAGVCIYGEMVDVLAARGQYKAAYQLEVLWNALGRARAVHAVLRICVRALRRSEDRGASSAEICEAHNHVHRKKDDLLAEFLLEQPAMPAASPSSTAFLIHATIHACR